jgi:hypothetical protein
MVWEKLSKEEQLENAEKRQSYNYDNVVFKNEREVISSDLY